MCMRNVAIAVSLILAVLSAAHGAEEEGRVFRAGAAASNITPWLGVSLAGNMSDQKAAHIHDELHARCFALDNGETRLGFALVDSCMVPREVFDRAKEQVRDAIGLDPAYLLMAATHSHTAACSSPVFQSDPDPAYLDFLARRIADGVRRAFNNLEPAQVGWGSGAVPDEVFNRRWRMMPGAIGPNPFGETGDQARMNPPRASADLVEPIGPTDPETAFLALRRADGRSLGVLANYSLHYVGGTRGGEVSADYFGVFAQQLTALLAAEPADPPFLAALSNGTSGDVNNINFREEPPARQPYEQMRHVAGKVAREVARAYGEVAFSDWAPLDAAQDEITLGVRKPTAADVERAQGILAAAQGPPYSGLDNIYARETVLLDAYPAEVQVIIQSFRIGDLAIVAIPCEVFAEIGLAIKAKSPFAKTFCISLANGYNGYLPTAAQHALGGYETWRARSSYLDTGAADTILETVFGQLERLAN